MDGIIKRHPDGFGFFIPDNPTHPDAYVSKRNMKGLMSNDRVHVEVYPERRGNRFRGQVLRLLERATTQVSGPIYRLNESQGLVRDESHSWGEDLYVSLERDVEVKDGDWVSIQITSYPEDDEGLRGTLLKVIGDGRDPVNDNLRVLTSHNIPVEFSSEALKEAKGLPLEVLEEDKKSRVDLRGKSLITIDGQTAKDFDDAICVQTEKSGFHLWVAIADVSHYVKRGSAIDRDAYERGTSTYFPNFCNPMLPEALSNELCSLKPDQDRLAMVAEMEFDFQGEMKSSKFYEAVIRSQARVTYGEAQEVLEGSPPESLIHVAKVIRRAADLAKVLMSKRMKEGSLSLEIPETEVKVDQGGYVQDILKSERIFAHKLIEELMLATNVAVARAFSERKVPTLYRTHEPPDPLLVDKLESYLEQFGFNKPLRGGKLQKKITKALEKFAGTPKEPIVNILTLRTMNQAQYTEENMGHFGLAFKNYTHFTSPIRRYPDLMIHRLLKSVVGPGKKRAASPGPGLTQAGTWLSACEQRSVQAERQLLSIKKARFMEQYIGRQFDGFISSVAKFGVFVVLRAFDVDGLVRVEDLPGGAYEFDEENLCLVNCATGRSYGVGDLMQIQVIAIDPWDGKIDFMPANGDHREPSSRERKRRANSKKKKKLTQKRGKASKNRRRSRQARVRKSRSKS